MGKVAEGEWSDEMQEQLSGAIFEAVDDFGPDFDEEGGELEEGESDRIKDDEERDRASRAVSDDDTKDESDESQESEDKEGAAA
jgi:hypothetical protein